MEYVDLRETSGVLFAYLGDAVWELYVRKYWISKGLNLQNLNKRVKECVNAKRQSVLNKEILPLLEEKYQQLGNRAKNGNIKSFPQTCTQMEYRNATGFEAYIAGLYIDGKVDEIKKIIEENIE